MQQLFVKLIVRLKIYEERMVKKKYSMLQLKTFLWNEKKIVITSFYLLY
jgi:hypothetical protein